MMRGDALNIVRMFLDHIFFNFQLGCSKISNDISRCLLRILYEEIKLSGLTLTTSTSIWLELLVDD